SRILSQTPAPITPTMTRTSRAQRMKVTVRCVLFMRPWYIDRRSTVYGNRIRRLLQIRGDSARGKGAGQEEHRSSEDEAYGEVDRQSAQGMGMRIGKFHRAAQACQAITQRIQVDGPFEPDPSTIRRKKRAGEKPHRH